MTVIDQIDGLRRQRFLQARFHFRDARFVQGSTFVKGKTVSSA
jgi:hypothetical protein